MATPPPSPLAAPTFGQVLARLDAVIRYPLASQVFLFALSDALDEWSQEELLAGVITHAGELAQRASAAAAAATAAGRSSGA